MSVDVRFWGQDYSFGGDLKNMLTPCAYPKKLLIKVCRHLFIVENFIVMDNNGF